MVCMGGFDIIVIGGGHAGAEAAWAAAGMGLNTALVSINLDTIGRMPCSPSIGGLAKSHLVKEIDALGGLMAEVADASAIACRVLNTSKGPAVQATRTQNDKHLYEALIKSRLEKRGVHLRQAKIVSLEVFKGQIQGARDHLGNLYRAKAVIVAAGTFLGGIVYVGEARIPAGRAGEENSLDLSNALKDLGFVMGRHKTGTPPRINMASIDLGWLRRQDPEQGIMPLSFEPRGKELRQVPCYMTRTSPQTHEIIRDNINHSPLYSGTITGKAARYCPSLEDKVMRFGDRKGHPVIIEPEGLHTCEVYASGLGNSMPVDIQWDLVHSVPGLERAEIMRPAYAIEYDYILPTQLNPDMETKKIKGLYLAGQVNGTSGYEEAAAQGVLAGINAGLRIRGLPAFVPERSRAYIGVMVDDLTTRGTSEPYRMFTSRAEYRLILRETSALGRLSCDAHAMGLITKERYKRVMDILEEIKGLRTCLKKTISIPGDLPGVLDTMANQRISMERLLKRPECRIDAFVANNLIPAAHPISLIETQIEIKYEGYIDRQLARINRFKGLEEMHVPVDLDFDAIDGLSNELKSRLIELRPATIGQVQRVDGMTPAGIQAIVSALRAKDP